MAREGRGAISVNSKSRGSNFKNRSTIEIYATSHLTCNIEIRDSWAQHLIS